MKGFTTAMDFIKKMVYISDIVIFKVYIYIYIYIYIYNLRLKMNVTRTSVEAYQIKLF